MKYIAALLLLAAPAFADEVVLRNGARFAGVVTREGKQVTVRMEVGTITFAAIDVASVRFGEDARDVEKTPPRDVKPVEPRAETVESSPPRASNSIVDRLEAEARERELERLRRAEESRLDALLSLELDRRDLERARLERDRTLELRRQRIEALRPPPVVLAPAAPCLPPSREPARPAKRFRWPIWGE
jgi:hypothetical protein